MAIQTLIGFSGGIEVQTKTGSGIHSLRAFIRRTNSMPSVLGIIKR